MSITSDTMNAYLAGDELVLEDFRETDPDVVAHVREAEDVEEAVHRCLAMGARALRLAAATLDTELVEHRFAELTSTLDRSVAELAQRVDDSARGLLDEEDGELASALRTWLADVEQKLGATFDENSKTSALAKLETVLKKAREDQVFAVRRLLDPDNDESPLSAWQRDIVREIKERGQATEKALGELREQLRIDEARAKEHERTTIKGLEFEQAVLEEVTRLVTVREDVPEHVGNTAGKKGKVGDLVVYVGAGGATGCAPRYVVEVKDESLALKPALDELERAIENRDAQAGLMVFSSQAGAPVREPFEVFDDKAIVVLDKESGDTQALRLACLWARWVCLRGEREDLETIDRLSVKSLIDAARLSLKTAATIKSCNTKAKNAIGDATVHLERLVSEVGDTLDDLERELGAAS